MTITRKQLEAVSNTAQNDAIALSEVYRESFSKRFNAELDNALNNELFSFLNKHNQIASSVVNTIAQTYAENISVHELLLEPVKLLKPTRKDLVKDDFQVLLPTEKPRLRAV